MVEQYGLAMAIIKKDDLTLWLAGPMSSAAKPLADLSRMLSQFIKGSVWGFVAFVHVALVTVLLYKFTLDCLPENIVMRMLCLPGAGAAQCPTACPPGSDLFFYILIAVTALSALFLPLAIGLYWAFKTRENPTVSR